MSSKVRAGVWSTPAALFGFTLLYGGLGLAGRLTVHVGSLYSPVWPAAGVGVVWFLARGWRARSVDSVALAACAFVVNALTGAPLTVSVLLTLTNLVQTGATVALLRRWAPELWRCGGGRALDSPRLLARFVAAGVLGTLAGAALGSLGTSALTGSVEALGAVLWFGRNLCGVLGIASLGLLLGHRLDRQRAGRVAFTGPSTVELVTLALFTAGIYALAFAARDVALGFTLLAATVWAGLRFPTLIAAAHSVVVGAVSVRLTLAGIGPFASSGGPALTALVVQLYTITIVATALALATGRDEREELQAALRHSQAVAGYEARIREAAFGSMTSGLVVLDQNGDPLLFNRAAVELLAPPGQTLARAHLAAVDRGAPGAGPVSRPDGLTRRALQGETVPETEVRLMASSGVDRVLAVSAVPLPHDERGRARALLLCRDSTVEHASREELSAFARVVAHDLRNPLAAIDGWTAMIGEELEGGEPPRELTKQFVDRVRSSTARMRELISDLLTHATSGTREITVSRVDLTALALDVARSRQAESVVTCRPVPPVAGDPLLLRQVVDNLVGNALKYVAPGDRPRIEVAGRLVAERADGEARAGAGEPAGPMVLVEVVDAGIGLPPGEHERVFEEFRRAHAQDYEGSGLGLAICRRIVSRHGGTITARDNPAGQGTVFEVVLPAWSETRERVVPAHGTDRGSAGGFSRPPGPVPPRDGTAPDSVVPTR